MGHMIQAGRFLSFTARVNEKTHGNNAIGADLPRPRSAQHSRHSWEHISQVNKGANKGVSVNQRWAPIPETPNKATLDVEHPFTHKVITDET